MDALPPEVASMLQGLQRQIAQLMAQRAAMVRDLSDQREDRALAWAALNKSHEAKLLKVLADFISRSKGLDVDLLGLTLNAERTLTGGGSAGDGVGASSPAAGAPPAQRGPGAALVEMRPAA
jgi:hypothetical protein